MQFESTRGTSPSLTSLDISDNYFEFTHVAEWLSENTNLTSLTLYGSALKQNGNKAFCEWFPKQSSLMTLYLDHVYEDFEGAEGCLKTPGKLQRFRIYHASYFSVTEGGLLLLDSPTFNKELRYLDICYSFRHPGYSASIVRLVGSLPLLTDINLRWSSLDHHIGEPLRRNTVLRTLDLLHCFRNEGDMVKVCEALHDHPTLTWLELGAHSHKETENNTLSAIGKLLQTRIPLRSLFFDYRTYNTLGMVDFVKGLKTNNTLTLLSLERNDLFL
eukprot:TRINITY_DN3095_c1_g1_i3.p1 TRINITY_DN3095_c1_g1~~TRINITY_DN3095_c1_g1_i3.p1  ORF type:complete len:273 (-),score=26.55 TRINITY_DN3095_c1_g1_i3:165-983(-)